MANSDLENKGKGAFWSDRRWLSLPAGKEPVQPYNSAALEDANYLLSIGDEIYVSAPDEKSTIRKLDDDKTSFLIEPGQFAFLLSAEKVTIPLDAIGFISIRASKKFMGLVNISGFHVDPGYTGKLIFAVFNAGPTRIHLKRGERIFPLWLSDLDEPIRRTTFKEGYNSIPTSLVTQISGDFTTAYQVKKQLDTIKEDVVKLNAFKYYVAGVIALLGIVLFPVIKERVIEIFSSSPSQTAPLPVGVAPGNSNVPRPSMPPLVEQLKNK